VLFHGHARAKALVSGAASKKRSRPDPMRRALIQRVANLAHHRNVKTLAVAARK